MGQSESKNYFAQLIAGSQVQHSSRYFEKGTFLVEIDNVKLFMNRKRQPRAAVECTVKQSSNSNLPAASSVSWIVSLDSDAGPSTVKTWIACMFRCSDADITSETIQDIFVGDGEDRISPASGFQAIVNAYEKPTRSGGVFTKCEWKRFEEGDALPDFDLLRAESRSVPDFMPEMESNNDIPY